MKSGHIITCLSDDEYERFIHEGFVGLYPIKVDSLKTNNCRSLSAKIGTNWDVIADLKRVKVSDYIFLHTIGSAQIHGPFETTSIFKEACDIPICFKSINLNIDFWKNNYVDLDFDDYPWRIGIKSINGITKTMGINAMELFKLKSIGIIQSLPERFMYHDKPKIVKPLLNNETEIILQLLNDVHCDDYIYLNADNLVDYSDITLDLSKHEGELFREKILEAWLMYNATFNGDNIDAHKNFISVFGNIEHYANSIFTYYANFLDVLFYNENTTYPMIEYCTECSKYTSKNKTNIWIVELKKSWCGIEVVSQLKEYGDWAKRALANNIAENVKLCIVALGFSNELSAQDEIKLVKYSLFENAPFLKLEKINF